MSSSDCRGGTPAIQTTLQGEEEKEKGVNSIVSGREFNWSGKADITALNRLIAITWEKLFYAQGRLPEEWYYSSRDNFLLSAQSNLQVEKARILVSELLAKYLLFWTALKTVSQFGSALHSLYTHKVFLFQVIHIFSLWLKILKGRELSALNLVNF